MIADGVKTAVSAIPVPKDGEYGSDGKSVTVEDVAPLIASEVEKRVSELPSAKDGKDGADGKDGVSLAGAFIDRDGNLAITLSNGEVKSLGPVAGKDGEPGKPGEDGFGFDDLSVEYDGEKTMTLKFTKGERVKEFLINMPVPIDRGVFKDDGEYKSGDGVSWAGSFWIAQKDNPTGKPDAGDWRLSVKRGRDGRDGVVKTKITPKVKI
jgi:ketosteroid isomerase-like protein